MVASELPFAKRVESLPRLGLGLSTEFGARHGGVDVLRLHREHPDRVAFLEIGCDLERGFDRDAEEWTAQGWPCTYHFLDVNLEERESLSPAWIELTRAQARAARAAWLCGDAGLWHVGPRDRGHGTLMPPVLSTASARAMAENVRALREQSGFEVLPENPPAHVYLGDLHLLEYFAHVSEAADCGLLLDVAHLAIYQHVSGHRWDDGLRELPWERVVEIHVAGGTLFEHGGRSFVDDDHTPEPLPDCWRLLDLALANAPNLRAVVYEAERNREPAVLAGLERIAERWASAPRPTPRPPRARRAPDPGPEPALRSRVLQRALFRMQLDPAFARGVCQPDRPPGNDAELAPREWALLAALDLRAVEADRGGARREQFLHNVSGEFALTLALLGREPLDRFPSSPSFHDAVRQGHSLPLALGRHLAATPAAKVLPISALLSLERALAHARRAPLGAAAAPLPGHVALASTAQLLCVPDGTHAAASALRAELASGSPSRQLRVPVLAAEPAETLLLQRLPARSPLTPGELRVERLARPVAALLEHCRTPQSHASLRDYAREAAIEPDALESVVQSFAQDGVLCGSLEPASPASASPGS